MFPIRVSGSGLNRTDTRIVIWKHGARLSTSRVMAIAFIFMSVLIVLSLSVNVIQGVNNYRLQNEQRTAVDANGI
ncbi:conjugative transfer protein [Escherichia coli]|nr:conjugative transfer protein [Escherichia coli]